MSTASLVGEGQIEREVHERSFGFYTKVTRNAVYEAAVLPASSAPAVSLSASGWAVSSVRERSPVASVQYTNQVPKKSYGFYSKGTQKAVEVVPALSAPAVAVSVSGMPSKTTQVLLAT